MSETGSRVGADGDDLAEDADENGVRSAVDETLLNDLALVRGSILTIVVDGFAPDLEGGARYLDGWIDQDCTGVFDEPGDRVIDQEALVVEDLLDPQIDLGPPQLAIQIAVEPGCTETYARFRLNSTNPELGPTGFAADGEVEDYRVTIVEAPAFLDLFDPVSQSVLDTPVPGSRSS